MKINGGIGKMMIDRNGLLIMLMAGFAVEVCRRELLIALLRCFRRALGELFINLAIVLPVCER